MRHRTMPTAPDPKPAQRHALAQAMPKRPGGGARTIVVNGPFERTGELESTGGTMRTIRMASIDVRLFIFGLLLFLSGLAHADTPSAAQPSPYGIVSVDIDGTRLCMEVGGAAVAPLAGRRRRRMPAECRSAMVARAQRAEISRWSPSTVCNA
ncbi:hypothetical protein V4E86_19085 [Burkholderia pseudomallei]